ncbi:hypothetical protein FRC12_008360 [Ceratobasidium sp. 428]|nr:hypothetical protein FRC12_008360 [Ceratobasidium sp. 428]
MSDLGHDSFMLDHWLTSICPSVEAAAVAGARFGSFFARLGGLKDAISSDLEFDFTNSDARELVLNVAFRGVYGNLLKCGIDPTEAEALTQSAVDMFIRQDEASFKVFSLGDCWPGSLLVLAGDGLAVIDWEFAGVNAPLRDIGQLAGHLYLLHETSASTSRLIIQAFALAFYRANRAQAPDEWYEISHRVDAWRLFGQEIVNNIVQMDWFDGDQVKKEEGMKVFGKKGVEFMKGAERRGSEEGSMGAPLFETVFARL